MQRRLLLASLGTAWIATVMAAYFWVGLAFMMDVPSDAAFGYWAVGWLLYGAVAAAPFIIYDFAGDS